eukprot:m.64932 g.64932  ORF g.64932 m.64932 type:complete len:143 (+) comp12036_c0_seq2:3128-3556(+)
MSLFEFFLFFFFFFLFFFFVPRPQMHGLLFVGSHSLDIASISSGLVAKTTSQSRTVLCAGNVFLHQRCVGVVAMVVISGTYNSGFNKALDVHTHSAVAFASLVTTISPRHWLSKTFLIYFILELCLLVVGVLVLTSCSQGFY